MSAPSEPRSAAVARAFDAAAGHYDGPALGFWDRVGRRAVERLALMPGDRVLDVCCGSGASALPAAERVGPEGRVLGLDVSPRMLDLARAKARDRGLGNVRLRVGDLDALDVPAGAFDAVVCVLGLFFAADLPAAVRSLWRAVRPGGVLAVVTWAAGPLEPAVGAFRAAVARERPDLAGLSSRDPRTETPEALLALLAEGGVPGASAEAEPAEHALDPGDWWEVVLGSGLRRLVDPLAPDARERVREATEDALRAAGGGAVRVGAVHAVAARPVDPASRPELWLDDMAPGRVFSTGFVPVEQDEVAAFARAYDPQPFHLDHAAGAASPFGALVASGWHTAALTMRLLVEQGPRPAGGIVGLGADELRWRAVRPGDRLRVRAEVLGARPTRGRPDRGVVQFRVRTLNQRGEEAQHMLTSLLVPRRA